ncbi:hypothetical protein H5410_024164 [Solanum commersonii]|uniref:Uncharacterized protein n=1 Tax=Solanum commersonii TaxID=4109 RepID=A0A9J5ZL72_SOLCO|nr:hypothetical protein H5410_024164 [Solanum commersonii]
MAGCYMRKMWSSFMSKTVGSKLPLLLYSSRLSCPSMQDSWLSPAVALFFKVILSQHARWLAVTSCCFILQVHFIFVTEVLHVGRYIRYFLLMLIWRAVVAGMYDKRQGRDDLMSPMPAKMNTADKQQGRDDLMSPMPAKMNSV